MFSLSDVESLFPELSRAGLKTLLGRACKNGIIERICRAIYIYKGVDYSGGYELFHAAARLRAGQFNYISLETALSDSGLISQIPLNMITIMSSGRKSIINCGDFGKIEFIHTKKKKANIQSHLFFDTRCRMWRADNILAYRDLQLVSRNLDLVDERGLNDPV